MRDRGRGRGGVLLAGVLALCGLGSVGASAASAAPSYRLAFGSTVEAAPLGGPLIIHGHRSSTTDPMMADQIIDHTDGSQTSRLNMGQLVYEEYPGSVSHRHWHYKGFVRYQLRSASDLSVVRPDNKAGFCLADPMYAPDYCGSMKPEALTVDEGMGAGTTDYYNPNLEGQYIDVTDVPPGDYWLVHWVNSAKEICETDYTNNAAAVKITLWPNGYGVAPYFTPGTASEPFLPPFYDDLTPPPDCGPGPSPAAKPPDLVQKKPTELGVTVVGGTPQESGQPGPTPAAGSPSTGSAPAVASAPTLSERLARRYVVRALTQRFHRHPRQVQRACRRVSRTSFLCRVHWRDRRYRYRGSVRIFTTRTQDGFERRFNLRVRRTDRRCTAEHRHGCSRMLEARNMRFRSTATRSGHVRLP
jgi:Lysyl oxidase